MVNIWIYGEYIWINADFNDMVKCKILRMRKTRNKDLERNRPQLAQRIVRSVLLEV